MPTKVSMTPKERWLAAVRMQPTDRLLFWPKLGSNYPDWQTGRYRTMDVDALHAFIGSDRHVGVSDCTRIDRRTCSVETTGDSDTMRTVYTTPHGTMDAESRSDPPSASWHPTEFPVKTPDDIALMTEIYLDSTPELDRDSLRKGRAESDRYGEDALTASTIGESALMHWIEFLAGVSMAHYLLVDYRTEVEALFDAMHSVLSRKAEIMAENSPADVLYMGENTSTTLISPEQYRRYSYAHIKAYGDICVAAGRPMVLHMCGHLKALLPDLSATPASAFEAFTSAPVGNTSFADGRAGCPDKCLIGGTNAALWTEPGDAVIREIERDLDDLPHHRGIAVTSAGVMPPTCDPETIRMVAERVHAYPAAM